MQGTLDDLTRDSRRYEIVIEGAPPTWVGGSASIRAEALNNGEHTRLVQHSNEARDVQPILDRLRHEQRIIVSVRPVRETLEDLFMRAVTDPNTGKALPPGALQGRIRAAHAGAAGGEA